MGFVDDVIMGEPGSSKIDISALVIDLSEQLPDPQPIVRIWGNLIASRGNVSTVVGLAKSRKTFLTAAVASGFLSSSDFLGFDTPATGKVVYIDTEQARAHVHKVARRILRSIGLPTDHNHDKLVVAALRELTPDQRREATGEILRRYKPDLLILDGVEIVSEMLNNIPPEAIESFSILRDATATALYGSRGANGVMIITTKNGRQSEKMAINVRLESGISMPTRVQDIADGVTYMENYNEALRTRTPAGETYVQHFSDEKITGTRNRLNPYVYPDNDWYSMLFKDFTVNENMNLNVRGGGKVVDYFLNASIFNENGILKKPAESKFNTNINSQKYLFQANVGA